MPLSDISLINISLFFINLMMALVFFLVWKTLQNRLHALMWSLFYVTAALNGVLNAFGDVLFDDRNHYWVVVNAVSLLSHFLAWAGFRLRNRKNPFIWPVFVYFIGVELLIALFTLWIPHMGLRMVLVPYSAALILVLIAWEVYRFDSPNRLIRNTAIVVFLLYSVIHLISGTIALMQGAEPNPELLARYSQANFLFMPAFLAGLGIFTLLLLVDDLASKMQRFAFTDQLTDVLNRRGLYQAAAKTETRPGEQRYVVIADLDDFKKVNDAYGHTMGDFALRVFARKLQKHANPDELVGRMGGEEFAWLMQGSSVTEVTERIDAARIEFANHPIRNGDQSVNVTASFGVSVLNQAGLEAAFKAADEAMYQAKKRGRNQVISAQS